MLVPITLARQESRRVALVPRNQRPLARRWCQARIARGALLPLFALVLLAPAVSRPVAGRWCSLSGDCIHLPSVTQSHYRLHLVLALRQYHCLHRAPDSHIPRVFLFLDPVEMDRSGRSAGGAHRLHIPPQYKRHNPRSHRPVAPTPGSRCPRSRTQTALDGQPRSTPAPLHPSGCEFHRGTPSLCGPHRRQPDSRRHSPCRQTRSLQASLQAPPNRQHSLDSRHLPHQVFRPSTS